MQAQIDKVEAGQAFLDTLPTPHVRDLASVKMKPVHWLWCKRFARGVLTLLAGPPGTGKSTIACSIAATVSTGGEWPDGQLCDGAGNVLMLTSEDDAELTLVPRLTAAGADLTRVKQLTGIFNPIDNNIEGVSLGRHIAEIKEAVRKIGGADLIVIDVLNSFVGGKLDTHRDSEVRTVLDPLNELAAETNAAVIANTHFSKDTKVKKAYLRVLGSIGYVGASRDVWTAIPDDDDTHILLNVKRNIEQKSEGCRYQIVGTDVTDEIKGIATIKWLDTNVTESADDVIARTETGDVGATALEEAESWLFEYLSEGRKPAKQVLTAAADDGISKPTLHRAKKKLEVISGKSSKFGGDWSWSLPDGTFNSA